ncbi:MAG: hypothetical protein K9K66_05545 [Desulfarculaceae bacterium]|nr:hypothetical protein [Desulfarculaceae bacterium]MCF8072937.1 hypothetical protein [Desulfarculaceae bacterium]MCF8101105.1 hypothetical protein [Desulfarculaceae bacterium]MCF8115508.1 hypothetical protein [Desulfarculaceae bacterium]
MAFIEEIKDGIGGLDPGRKDLRNLGLVFLAALGLIAGLMAYKGNPAWPWLAGAAVLFGAWGLVWPAGLRPLYMVWMSLALVLGAMVSRIILTVLFYLVVTPIGLVLRAMGKDLLDLKLKDRESYWHRDQAGQYLPEQTEKMY